MSTTSEFVAAQSHASEGTAIAARLIRAAAPVRGVIGQSRRWCLHTEEYAAGNAVRAPIRYPR